MKILRIFISSPGDVRLERVRALDVVSRLQTKFRAFLKLEPILWEHDAQSGWASFQANIIPPSKTDIVICILWARIGMRLPEDYKRADGSVPTGTEWEFEDAYAGYKLNGTPDLYVYRKTANPTIEVTSEESLEEWRRQKQALDRFFERWFRDHDGAFKAGFNTFQRDEEFGKMLEQHLERVINQRIQQEEGYSAEEERKITWFEGSPSRGLSAFQPEHAPVFFGRDLEIREITDRLVIQSGAGKVFLMILGMSGCGKSSLARAGVLPALLQPGAVAGVDCWRRLILRPSEVLADLLDGLAQGLLSSQALPELEKLGFNAQQLSALLSEAPAHAIPPLDAALRQVGRHVGAERMLSGVLTCRLLVIVDQLEEMFTLERFDSGQRQRFITALGALCRSGLAWIVTTMRIDLYARCGEVEELLGLKGQDGQYDLRPPGFTEVGQMIRLPARAAGLRFELEPESSKALDDALHEEAWKNPEALPLLEFTLEELYRAKGDSNLLSWRAYRSLGGMQGAIARRAEEVYESLSAEGKAALASVFSLLVLIPEREAATGKPAPLVEFKLRPGAEEVVKSFAKASLLLSDVDAHGTSVVSLAHEALLSSWPRLQQNYEFLKVRERVAMAAQRWSDEQGAEAYLLAEGKPLVEAKELLNQHPETLSRKEMVFIRASIESERMRRKREAVRRRKVLIAISVALVVAIVFGVISFWQYQKATIAALNEKKAAEQEKIARQNAEESAKAANNARDQADGLINFMLFDLRDKLMPIGRLN
jgi:cell division protein FtsB